MEKNYETDNNLFKNDEHIYNKPKLVILVGISGSGKSTFCNYYDPSMIRVNRDSLRTMMSSKTITSYYDQNKSLINAYENIVNGCEERLLNYFAKKRKNVIIDNCNLRKEYIQKYLDIFKDYDVWFKLFDADIDQSAKNIIKRDGKVNLSYLKRQYQQYKEIIPYIKTNYQWL